MMEELHGWFADYRCCVSSRSTPAVALKAPLLERKGKSVSDKMALRR